MKTGDKVILFCEKHVSKWIDSHLMADRCEKLLTFNAGNKLWTAPNGRAKRYATQNEESHNVLNQNENATQQWTNVVFDAAMNALDGY